MTTAIKDELLDLERQGWDSLCNSTGADFYGQIMTDNGVMILAHGFVFDRQQVIESLNAAPPWRKYEISEERLIPLGESAAVLVYRGTAWRNASMPDFLAWMATTYIHDNNQWKLASYQQTPIPPEEK